MIIPKIKKNYLRYPQNPVEGCSFDSEYFLGVHYIIKDDHIVINDSFGNGILSIKFDRVDRFISELKEIKEVYGEELS
ncbi:hypothetical protein [Eubacterium maltosivorans]|uniref:hypothetical protein n=1 Tax=Eubacterium maltosivorans TaxID=2041044 RepID=UPI00189C7FA3|nr:hypothetical protein [Eubacterium maltosivorans]